MLAQPSPKSLVVTLFETSFLGIRRWTMWGGRAL
ncbi:MAG: hypothetical protein QOG37_2588, partial [Mycobacterium sp.]|nr:hypothetical protein [Mycobacterium sp.]